MLNRNVFSCFSNADQLATSRSGSGRSFQACSPEYERLVGLNGTFSTNRQCCNLETMVSRFECTRVHFVQVSVSRPGDPGLGLGLKTACLLPTPVARLP